MGLTIQYFKSLLVLGAICFSTMGLFGQKYTLEGRVADSLGQALEVATVILLQARDSTMSGFSITNPKGEYKITGVKEGSYLINATYLGYEDYWKKIEISQNTTLEPIFLNESSEHLVEITVSASHVPIRLKKDTVEYNAAAFKTLPSDNIETLLKKLPGVEVEKDGSIKAHGEQVQKILVDGKEFFGNDPTIATKNLPASAVDKVQIFDKASDVAEFSGIDDGERSKTINITLKDGQKAGYFGTAEMGAGTEERYDGKMSINRFTRASQLSTIGMINNVNKQGFSFREYMSFMGGLGSMMGGGGGGRGGSGGGIQIANDLGKGFVNTGAGGLNYSHTFSPKLEFSSSYFYNNIENILSQSVERQNITIGNEFDTDQLSDINNNNKNHKIDATIRSNPDSSQRFILRLSGAWNDGNAISYSETYNYNEDGFLLSDGVNDNSSTGTGANMNADLSYMRRFRRIGRVFSVNAKIGSNDTDGLADIYGINGFNRGNIQRTDTILQQQSQLNEQTNYSFRLSYTEPLGRRKYLEFNASRQNFRNDYEKLFYDLNFRDRNIRTLNNLLSNSYNRNFSYNQLGFNIKVNKENSSLTTGLTFQHSDLNGELRSNEQTIKQDYFYVLPSLNWNREFGATKSLRFRYLTRVNEPSLEQLQPQIDNSDPLNIYIGNPDLRPEYTHSANINFNTFSQFSNIGFFSSLNFRYTKNSITNTRTVNEFFIQTTMPVNVDFAFNSSLYFNFNAPLKFIGHRVSVSNSLSFNKNILFINQLENKVDRINDNIRLSFDNLKKDIFDLRYGASINLNSTKYSSDPKLNQNYVNYNYFADLDIDIKSLWTISTGYSLDVYSQEDFGEKITLPIWKASMSRILLKSKKLKIDLAVYDILNNNRNISRSSNLNYVQDERVETLGRYAMISLSYSFSGFGNQNSWMGSGGRGRR